MIKKKKKKSTKKVLATAGVVLGVGAVAVGGYVGVDNYTKQNKKIETMEVSINEKTTLLATADNKLNETTLLLTATQTALAEVQTDNEELETELTEAQALVANYIADIGKLRELVQNTNGNPELSTTEAQSLYEDLIAFVDSVNAQIEELNSTIEAKENKITTLNEANKELQTQIEELGALNAELNEQLQAVGGYSIKSAFDSVTVTLINVENEVFTISAFDSMTGTDIKKCLTGNSVESYLVDKCLDIRKDKVGYEVCLESMKYFSTDDADNYPTEITIEFIGDYIDVSELLDDVNYKIYIEISKPEIYEGTQIVKTATIQFKFTETNK
ncbi:MAG: hypothetical protein IJZ29_04310 [Clostridia bacterium]|nr:hypothetical protein [Clostridia bacterium]